MARSRRGRPPKVALLDQVQDRTLLVEHLALLLQHLQLLDVDRVQRRQGDVVGLGSGVLTRRDHVLPDDDDRQQHQLQERLAQPGDAEIGVAGQECVQGLRERNERDQNENVGGPHRAHRFRDVNGEPAVESPHRAGAVNHLGDTSRCDQARFVVGGALPRRGVGGAMLGTADPPFDMLVARFLFVHLGA